MALLRRDMRFRSLAIRRLAAVVVAGIVGVYGAFQGWGAWSLVANEIAYGIVSVFTLWTVSPWRPGFQWSRTDFRELFGFGSNVVGSDVLNFLSRNSDNFLVGAFLGLGPLGLYGIGYKILDTTQTLLVNAARKLAFPVFSRIQGDPVAHPARLRSSQSRTEHDHPAGLHRPVARGSGSSRRDLR